MSFDDGKKFYELIDDGGEVVTLELMGELAASSLKEVEDEMMKYVDGTPKHIIAKCELVKFISMKWVKYLLEVQLKLRKAKRGLVLVGITPEVKQLLKSEGVDSAFPMFTNIKDAQRHLGVAPKRKLDTEFINPFLTATLQVLKVQASVNAVAGKYYVKKAEEVKVGDVSGVIGIVSDTFNGTVIISFPEQTFLKVMSGMLGEDITELNKDIVDGAGEITNMIFGQAKVVLNEKGYGIKMALPSVVSGKGHSLSTITQGLVLVIPFQSEAGDFFVEICLSA